MTSNPELSSRTGKLLEGKRVVVTGAGARYGIGRATAELFAAHGARIAVCDINAEWAAELARTLGPGHVPVTFDVTDVEACTAAVKQVASEFGGIDILVNNAGITKGTPLLETTLEEYDFLQSINLRSMFVMSQLVVPFMRAAGQGNIVCMSSAAAHRGGGLYGSSHYAATKAGIIGLAKGLAREFARDGIRVNVVAPSLIKTDGAPDDTPERRAQFERDVPMGRSGTAIETAGAALFLASDLASYVTGATIDVNGGFYIR